MRTIKPLDALIGTTRQKVLAQTHLHPDRWWYLHELARALGLRPSSIQRELKVLFEAGILLRRQDGNRIYLKADLACPIFHEIQTMLIKTVGLVDLLKEALEPFRPKIRLAFIYGSIASSEERSTSDVDLMILGSTRLAELAPALRDVERRIDRSVNATLYAEAEFVRKLKAGHSFLKNVANGEKLFIIGNADELAIAIGEWTR
jgi:DNA-binding transcriptional ArsR family regulator